MTPAPKYFAPGEVPRLRRHPSRAQLVGAVALPVAPVAKEPGKLRQRIVRLPTDALLDVLSGRLRVSNIPAGAKLVSSWFDADFDGATKTAEILCLRIEDDSLPEAVVGSHLPRQSAILEKRR